MHEKLRFVHEQNHSQQRKPEADLTEEEQRILNSGMDFKTVEVGFGI